MTSKINIYKQFKGFTLAVFALFLVLSGNLLESDTDESAPHHDAQVFGANDIMQLKCIYQLLSIHAHKFYNCFLLQNLNTATLLTMVIVYTKNTLYLKMQTKLFTIYPSLKT